MSQSTELTTTSSAAAAASGSGATGEDESEFLSLISHQHEIEQRKRAQRMNAPIDEETGNVRESLVEYEAAALMTEEEIKQKELAKKKGLQASLAHR
jgi:hypothetical protein